MSGIKGIGTMLRITAMMVCASLALVMSGSRWLASPEKTDTERVRFFERLMFGGAERGQVYIEVPLKASRFAHAKTPSDGWRVWDEFFMEVLHEQPDFARPGKVAYWGDYVCQNVDWQLVASAVDVQVGDTLRIRTQTQEGSAKVIRYEIHYSEPGDANLLLAVAQPLNGFKVQETDLLVSATRLPRCEGPCNAQQHTQDAFMLKKIYEAVKNGAKIPADQQLKDILVVEGFFTRPARQYIVYADFGTDWDGNLIGYWRTVVLDSDLSVIAVVGENNYEHVLPRSAGDVDGDGLDEVWVSLNGYEGYSAGLMYWCGGSGSDSFKIISSSYEGA